MAWRFARRCLAVLAAAVLAGSLMGAGCEPDCQDACDRDEDCGGDLVCYGSRCAPKECRENCYHEGLNLCRVNRVTCDYLGCGD